MVSCDTNVLFAASNPSDPNHETALGFVSAHANDQRFVIAEQVLVELYCLLRNPAVQSRPLSASEAASVIAAYRRNPDWSIVDIPATPEVMNAVWRRAASRDFARRRIHDVRLAETLKHWGVDEFHTRNTRDFEDLGFRILSNPFN
ncbi:MAG: PIN domain-containing protein [Kiritimatiellae bacterium]|jgi:toxin-antitoxin system PIN domain toxin|nr:PIN domain-containing protein [Kiritimatiellia bacterium]